jgi:hypothetical protein
MDRGSVESRLLALEQGYRDLNRRVTRLEELHLLGGGHPIPSPVLDDMSTSLAVLGADLTERLKRMEQRLIGLARSR